MQRSPKNSKTVAKPCTQNLFSHSCDVSYQTPVRWDFTKATFFRVVNCLRF